MLAHVMQYKEHLRLLRFKRLILIDRVFSLCCNLMKKVVFNQQIFLLCSKVTPRLAVLIHFFINEH